jgi:hypothetical protein
LSSPHAFSRCARHGGDTKNAKGFLWLAAVAASLVIAGWFAWMLVTLARDDDAYSTVWWSPFGAAFLFIPALSVFALWIFRPRV